MSNSSHLASTAAADLVSTLAAHAGQLSVTWQGADVDFTPTSIPACGPVLLWFSGEHTLTKLKQILSKCVAAGTELSIQLLQPTAALPPAICLQGPSLLPPAQLQALATQLGCQLVFLTERPTLAKPGLLVMDMDSTAIEIECIDEIAKLAGVGEQVAAVTAKAMNGELDFVQSLRQRVAALSGAPESVLAKVLAQLPLMPGLTELVTVLQQHQWQVAIASGGFTYFTDALKQRLQLTATYANQLEIKQGVLTGEVTGAIVDAKRKAAVVTELAAQYQIPHTQTVAIGDGANDLPMLATAGLGVAFHAKPKVQAAAKAAITRGSLLQLLYLVAPA